MLQTLVEGIVKFSDPTVELIIMESVEIEIHRIQIARSINRLDGKKDTFSEQVKMVNVRNGGVKDVRQRHNSHISMSKSG